MKKQQKSNHFFECSRNHNSFCEEVSKSALKRINAIFDVESVKNSKKSKLQTKQRKLL